MISSGNIQNKLTYEYERNGNINKTFLNDVVINNYDYDDLNRLIYETNKYSTPHNAYYRYDTNGNIIWKYVSSPDTDTNYVFCYDDYIKDRLTSITIDNQVKKFEYNDTFFGNPTFYGTGLEEDKNGVVYTWEGRRLVNYYDNIKNLNIGYKYNSQGLRIEKDINGKKTKFLYDGNNLISEITLSDGISKGKLLHFTYDANDILISIKYNGISYYYVRDLTGNIIGLVDDSGVIVVKYEYDAFGNVLYINDTSNNDLGNENPFIFKGYYYDFETSMYYCKTRYYIPEWCRWLNADDTRYIDIKSVKGLNIFAYCGNNPVKYYDPSGNSITLILLGIGLGGLISGFSSALTAPEEKKWAAFWGGFVKGAITTLAVGAALATGGVAGFGYAAVGGFFGGFFGSLTAQSIMSDDNLQWDTALYQGGLNTIMSVSMYFALNQLGVEGGTLLAKFTNSVAPSIVGASMSSYFESFSGFPNITETLHPITLKEDSNTNSLIDFPQQIVNY